MVAIRYLQQKLASFFTYWDDLTSQKQQRHGYYRIIALLILITAAIFFTFVANHSCDFVKIKLRKDSESERINFDQGIWQGQIDRNVIYEDCSKYVHTKFDGHWLVARVATIFADVLALSTFVLALESLYRLSFDKQRKRLIAITCIEVIISQFVVFSFFHSNGCQGITATIDGEDFFDPECVQSVGFGCAIAAILFWTFTCLQALAITALQSPEFEIEA